MNKPTESKMLSCLRCGGKMIEARLQSPGMDRQVYLHFITTSDRFHGDHNPVLAAWVCEDCGHVEVYAK